MLQGIRIAINRKRFLRIFIVVVVLLPSLVLLTQIVKQAVNTPYQDQWELVPVIQSIDKGTFSPVDLWSLHNQHRLFFPKMIMLISAYMTHWNVGVEMIISWLLALSCFVVLLLLMKKIGVFRKKPWVAFLTILTTAVMIFSFNQVENWLWGWQLQWYLCNLGVLLAILLLTNAESNSKKHLLGAIIAGTVATYSLASGQFVWPIGLLILWILQKPIKVWLGASALVLASYYVSYHPVGYQTPRSYLLEHPLSVIKYFFSYMGRPITENGHYTFIVGLVGFIVATTAVGLHVYVNKPSNFKRSLKIIIAPLSMMIFALLNAAVTTLSRSGLGFEQSLSSRYITVGGLFWIGFIWLMVIIVYEDRKQLPNSDIIISTFLCLMLGLALSASVASTYILTSVTSSRRNTQQCTRQKIPQDVCLLPTYPSTEVVRQRIDYLKQKHWAGY